MAKKVTRQRAWWTPDGERDAQLVTILERGRRKSRIRTAHGFVKDGIPNKELDRLERDDPEEPSEASFTFETPGAA